MTRPLFAVVSMVLAGVPLRAAPAAGQPVSSPKRIVVLNYYGNDQPQIKLFDEGLQQVINASSPGAVDFHIEYLDFGRRSGQLERSMRARHLREMYDDGRVSVVVAVADGALNFIKTQGLFEGVPIVAYTQRQPPPDAATSEPNVLRIWNGTAAAETIALALRLHPRTRQLFVLSGRPDNDGEYESAVRAQLEPFAKQVQITYLTDLPMSELVARVRTLPSDALLLLARLVVSPQANRSGQTDTEILSASPVPGYSLISLTVGRGAVGGYVSDLAHAGSQVGDAALRVAMGTPIARLTSQQLQPVPLFDARQLKRWGIDRRDLPAESVVRFEQQGFWDQYRAYILAAVLLGALQTAVIGALFAQHARRRETEERNTAILRAVPDTMFLLDRNGVYVDYRPPPGDTFPVPWEQFLGRHIRDVLPPPVLERMVPLFHRARETDQPVAGEYTIDVAGSQRQYEVRLVRCSEGRVLGVRRDITDRTRAEKALIASEQRYALATAAGRSGVWDWDLQSNEIYVDPSLKAALGFDDDEIQNRLDAWMTVVHPDDRQEVLEHAQAHVDGKSPFYEVEHRMLHKDGSIRWFLARGSAVRRDGTAVRVVGTETDITERKHSEQALQEAQTDLARVSRLTSLGEFAASIAHEVSQPLTAILMNTRTCLRWLGGASPNLPELREALSDVVDAAKRAEEVIRRNRELFRHHIVQKAMLDINSVISEAAAVAGERLRNGQVRLTTALAPGLPPAIGDRVELEQVLLNLIVNGIDAMENVDRDARQIEIASTLAIDGAIQVSVRDCGIGLEGVDLARMFSPAYTTKSNGTGVGLSISRLIIEAHGGLLWAEQNQVRGATFSFTVPIAATAAAISFV